jgi:hypothetical protein
MGAWPLDDEVLRLRVFGTEQVHELASGPHVQTIGSSSRCDIGLGSRDGTVAPQHAKLLRRQARWTIQAIDDPPGGVLRDRVPLREFPVVPGLEIGIGKITLIAESQRSLALRRSLARLIGYGAAQRVQVDRALGSVLATASGRRALMLCGDGDLIHVARQLHRHALDGHPFIVCDPRRMRGKGDARSSRNILDAMDALAAAAGGTLCLHAKRLPEGFESMVERWRGSAARVQLVVCDRAADPVVSTLAESIDVPPIFLRSRDLQRIIAEIAADAATELGVAPYRFTEDDARLVLDSDATALPELERAIYRIVALRHWAVTPASRKLGISHAALFEWAIRRGLVYAVPRTDPPRDRRRRTRA